MDGKRAVENIQNADFFFKKKLHSQSIGNAQNLNIDKSGWYGSGWYGSGGYESGWYKCGWHEYH